MDRESDASRFAVAIGLSLFAEPLHVQPERARRFCKISVCGGHTTCGYICRYGEMKGIQGSQRNRHQPYEEITSFNRMPVFQRMHLKKTIDDVIFEVSKRTLL